MRPRGQARRKISRPLGHKRTSSKKVSSAAGHGIKKGESDGRELTAAEGDSSDGGFYELS